MEQTWIQLLQTKIAILATAGVPYSNLTGDFTVSFNSASEIDLSVNALRGVNIDAATVQMGFMLVMDDSALAGTGEGRIFDLAGAQWDFANMRINCSKCTNFTFFEYGSSLSA